jgi:hypothetical protein
MLGQQPGNGSGEDGIYQGATHWPRKDIDLGRNTRLWRALYGLRRDDDKMGCIHAAITSRAWWQTLAPTNRTMPEENRDIEKFLRKPTRCIFATKFDSDRQATPVQQSSHCREIRNIRSNQKCPHHLLAVFCFDLCRCPVECPSQGLETAIGHPGWSASLAQPDENFRNFFAPKSKG